MDFKAKAAVSNDRRSLVLFQHTQLEEAKEEASENEAEPQEQLDSDMEL